MGLAFALGYPKSLFPKGSFGLGLGLNVLALGLGFGLESDSRPWPWFWSKVVDPNILWYHTFRSALRI